MSTIAWASDKCSATKTEDVKFSLDSPSNRPALSFVTVSQVEGRIIPTLKKMEAKLVQEGGNKTASDELVKLRLGLKGWDDTMKEYDETNKKAKDGDLRLTNSPSQWLLWAKNNTGRPSRGVPEPLGVDLPDFVPAQGALERNKEYIDSLSLGISDLDMDATWTGLIPFDLLEHSEPLAETKTKQDKERQKQLLRGTNTFEFSGGKPGSQILCSVSCSV